MTLRTGESAALPGGWIDLAVDCDEPEGAACAEVCALVVYGATGDEGGDGDGSGGRYGGDGGSRTGHQAAELVHAGAPVAAGGAVRHHGGGGAGGGGRRTVLGVLSVDLAALPAEVAALVVLARAAGDGPGTAPATRVRVTAAAGAELACHESPVRPGPRSGSGRGRGQGRGPGQGRADGWVRVLGACVRHGRGWRFRTAGPGAGRADQRGPLRAVARAGGLPPDEVAGLAALLGPGPEDVPNGARGPAGTRGPAGAPAEAETAGDMLARDEPSGDRSGRAALPPAEPVRPGEIRLTRRAPAVTLARQGAVAGTLRLTLDRAVAAVAQAAGSPAEPATDRTPVREYPARGRAEGRRPATGTAGDHRGQVRPHGAGDAERPPGVPDLCALFELTDGGRGVVQALGDATGSLREPPYIRLDGADTGAGRPGSGGTSVALNLDHADRFRRVLFFLTVQPGAAGFAGLRAAEVTLRPEHGAAIRFGLGACADLSTVCALALIQRDGPDLVVRREARYLVPPRGVSPQRTADYAYGWGLNWRPFT